MFWPPKWSANNKVTIEDLKFAAANAGEIRFAPFVQDATVLAPWLSWVTIDTRWPANDSMARFLLCGQSSSRVRTVNHDGVGSIITIGTVDQGWQKWEVVSSFEYYEDDETSMMGTVVWCRMYTTLAPDDGDGEEGGGGEEGGDPDIIIFAEGQDDDVEQDTLTWFLGSSGLGTLVIVHIVRSNLAATTTSVSYAGLPLAMIHQTPNADAGFVVETWWAAIASPVSGTVTAVASTDVRWQAQATVLNGVDDPTGCPTFDSAGDVTPPASELPSGPTPEDNTVMSAIVVQAGAGSGAMDFGGGWTSPVDAFEGPLGTQRVAFKKYPTAGAAPTVSMFLGTTADWQLHGQGFF